MTGKTKLWLQEIRRRAECKRKRKEKRIVSGLALCSLFLFANICILLRQSERPGLAAVPAGYGAVLLRDGASGYVVVGIAAFVLGALLTALCIRLRK